MSMWRVWHPDPSPDWCNVDPAKPEPFSRPLIKWGGLRAKCPDCGQPVSAGRWLFLSYTMHYASAHLGIRVFRNPLSGAS